MHCYPFSKLSRAMTLAGMALSSAMPCAFAQARPDAGKILQDVRNAPAAMPPSAGVVVTTPAASAATPIDAAGSGAPSAPESAQTTVRVSRFDVTGNAVVSDSQIAQVLASFTERPLSLPQLLQAVEAVDAYYRRQGFLLARARLPPQEIRDGVVHISIEEGRLGEVRTQGDSRIASDVVLRHLDEIPRQRALALPEIERQVLLVNYLAGGKVVLELQAGQEAGTTDLVLRQTPEDAISTRAEINNFGSPSTGTHRLGIFITGNSLFEQGERITFNALTSQSAGLGSYALRGELPVGKYGWRLHAAVGRASYQLGQEYADLQSDGTADSQRLGLGYPLWLSRAGNARVQFEVDQTQLNDNLRSQASADEKNSEGLNLSLDADWRDDLAGAASNQLDLLVRSARLEMAQSTATWDSSDSGYGTQGNFSKMVFNIARQQSLSPTWGLLMGAVWQLASKNLDSSEKLSLGGAQSLPGYASGEASGDAGYQLKLQLRWQAWPSVALSVFTNYAELQLNRTPLDSDTINTRVLGDYGWGLDWSATKDLSANLLMGWPGKATNNAQDLDKPRLWFTLSYTW